MTAVDIRRHHFPRYFFISARRPSREIGARHAEGDVGAEETRFRAAIMPLALEFDAVEALRFRKPDHGVGELDFAAGAALLGLPGS